MESPKKVRYDRVLLSDPTHLQITCSSNATNAAATGDSNSHPQQFACHSPRSIRILGADPFNQEGQLWVSDHFGLASTVNFSFAATINSDSIGLQENHNSQSECIYEEVNILRIDCNTYIPYCNRGLGCFWLFILRYQSN